MHQLCRAILKNAVGVLIASLLLTAAGTYYTVLLFKNLKTDIEELLPTTARSVIDLNEVTSRLESTENIAIIILSQDTLASKRFVIDLAKRLEAAPRSIIASVEYKIDRELEFFEARRALYLELGDLERIKGYIQARIRYETELYNPLNLFRSEELPEPFFDFIGLQSKYAKKVSAYTRFPDGYYASPDQKIRILIANLPGKLSSVDIAHRMRATLDQAIAELNPKSYAPDLEIKFSGGVQNLIEEHASLVHDLALTTIIVAVLVSLSMYCYYQAFIPTTALILSLFFGTFWTFGLSYFIVGYLNANSAFLGGIVLGNGINFGIIFLARYMEEKQRGRIPVRAIYLAFSRTLTATLTAALAAGLAYGSLMLTGFRGFNQFGLIGLIGMVLCWIASYTTLPVLLYLFDRPKSLAPLKPKRAARHLFGEATAWLVSSFPKTWVALGLVLTLGSAYLLVTRDVSIIETDLSRLRDKKSLESGSAYLTKYVDEVFQRYLSPIVVLPRETRETSLIAHKMKEHQKLHGEKSFISAVYSMEDFVPRNQPEKIQLLRQIQELLPPKLLRRFSEEDRKKIAAFLSPDAFNPIVAEDLPPLIREKFREKDGTLGKLVLVEPPISKALWDGDNLITFVKGLREVADQVEPGVAVAGQLPVSSDMFEAIRHDGPIATVFAFLAVFLLIVVLFRNLRIIAITSLSLWLGVLWLFGLIYFYDLKINFLNFIALPITFGIGVDYGVNIFQRYRLEGRGSILSVLRHTGSAVALASLTTVIGYGSLLIAGNQAFVSFGKLAVAGELTCLLAALVVVPAFLYVRDQWKSPSPRLP